MKLGLLEVTALLFFTALIGFFFGVLAFDNAGARGRLICGTPSGEVVIERAHAVKFTSNRVRWTNSDTGQTFTFNGMCMLRAT